MVRARAPIYGGISVRVNYFIRKKESLATYTYIRLRTRLCILHAYVMP